ncbi:MAG TPA: YceI family protein [Bryobacteraceae bacterium]|nr:YceI family protein [Bryobacteraceae bacterium]
MRKNLTWPLLAIAVVAPLTGATWQIDSSHSSAQFAVRHMMVSNVRGEFSGVRGTVDYDPANPSQSKIDVTIDATTVNTREAKRDAHLKNADFLDVEKHPTMTFRSKRVETAGPGKLKVTGDLMLRGTTREVVLDVEGPSTPVTMRGTQRTGASATTKINRSDYGLTWNRAVEAGGVVVGDEVTITIDVELTAAAPGAATTANAN